MLLTSAIFFGLACALLVAFAMPSRYQPWLDGDRCVRCITSWLLRRIHTGFSLDSDKWAKSADERCLYLKYLLFGVLLILVFPFHSITGSQLIIDFLWDYADKFRGKLLGDSSFGEFSHSHDWRSAPYDLWEICIFIWTITFVGRSFFRDYDELQRSGQDDVGQIISQTRFVGKLIIAVIFIGVLSVIVFHSGVLRLLFEIIVVSLLCCSDYFFARRYAKRRRMSESWHFVEGLLFVDLPALIGFAVLLLFVVSCDLKGYRSHWSSSFVAGAAAMNLLLANLAMLFHRATFGYRKQAAAVGDSRVVAGVEEG